MLKHAAVCACAAGLALAPAAGAATVHGQDVWGVSYSQIDYTAAPGEANRVTISGEASRIRLDDAGALILSSDDPTSTTGCLAAAQTAWCTTHYVGFMLFADLGDGNDAITTSPQLLGSTIHGGAGNDRFDGGGDYYGGPGADDMRHGEAWYTDATGPVTVTLDDRPDDGTAGERDNVHADMTRVLGSAFGDRLTAGPSGTRLEAGAGDDTLTGGAGADALYGQDGDDTITGGPGADWLEGDGGNDVIDARDGQADQVYCGAGDDTVAADPEDHVDASTCETVT